MAESVADQLATLTTLVQQAKAVPMSASCMLNRAELLRMLEAVKTAHTEELAAAQEATNASPPVLQRARAEAEQIVAAAEEKAKYLVDNTTVLTTARQQAGDLHNKAVSDTEALRREADLFVDQRVAALEAGLQKTLSQIQVMRNRLEARANPGQDAAAD